MKPTLEDIFPLVLLLIGGLFIGAVLGVHLQKACPDEVVAVSDVQ